MKNIKTLFITLLTFSVLVYCGDAIISLNDDDNNIADFKLITSLVQETKKLSLSFGSGNDRVHFNDAFGGKKGTGKYMSVKTNKEFNKLVDLVSSNLKKLNPKKSTLLQGLGTIDVPKNIRLIFSVDANADNSLNPQNFIDLGYYTTIGGKIITPNLSNITLFDKNHNLKSIPAITLAVAKAKKSKDKAEILALIINKKAEILNSNDPVSTINSLINASSEITNKAEVTITENEVNALEKASSEQSKVTSSSSNSTSSTSPKVPNNATNSSGSGSVPTSQVNITSTIYASSYSRRITGGAIASTRTHITLRSTVSDSIDGGITKLALEGNHDFKQTIDPTNFDIVYTVQNDDIATSNINVDVKRNPSNAKELLFTISSSAAVKDDKHFYIRMKTLQVQGYSTDYRMHSCHNGSSYYSCVPSKNVLIPFRTKGTTSALSKSSGSTTVAQVTKFTKPKPNIQTSELKLGSTNQLKLKFDIPIRVQSNAMSSIEHFTIFVRNKTKNWLYLTDKHIGGLEFYKFRVTDSGGSVSSYGYLDKRLLFGGAWFAVANTTSYFATRNTYGPVISSTIGEFIDTDISKVGLLSKTAATVGTDIEAGVGEIAILYCSNSTPVFDVKNNKVLLGNEAGKLKPSDCGFVVKDITITN